LSCHLRPRAAGLRFTLVLFRSRVLGERVRARPPLLAFGWDAAAFQRFLMASEKDMALGMNVFCV
jgi:hypothetical protein